MLRVGGYQATIENKQHQTEEGYTELPSDSPIMTPSSSQHNSPKIEIQNGNTNHEPAIISSANETVIEINTRTDSQTLIETSYTPCPRPIKMMRPLIYTIPLANALVDMSQTNAGLVNRSLWLNIPITAFAFFASFGLNTQFSIHNIDEVYGIVRTRQLPADWPIVSKNRKRIAVAATAVMISYVVFADSIQAYYFANKMPTQYNFNQYVDDNGWAFPRYSIAAINGISLIFNEGVSSYLFMSEMLSTEKKQYTNLASKIVSQSIGYTLGTFGGLNDSIASFSAMRLTLDVADTNGLIGLGSVSIFIGLSDFFMNGRYSRDSIDTFIDYAWNRKATPKQIISFILAATGGSLLAYSYQQLMSVFYEATVTDFGLKDHEYVDPFTQTSSVLGALNFGITSTANLYPLAETITNKISNMMNGIYSRLTSCCKTHTVNTQDDLEAQQSMLHGNQDDNTDYDDDVYYDAPTHFDDEVVVDSENKEIYFDVDLNSTQPVKPSKYAVFFQSTNNNDTEKQDTADNSLTFTNK